MNAINIKMMSCTAGSCGGQNNQYSPLKDKIQLLTFLKITRQQNSSVPPRCLSTRITVSGTNWFPVCVYIYINRCLSGFSDSRNSRAGVRFKWRCPI